MMGAKKLDGKTVLITGASRGIGAAVALAMAEGGAHVILSARTISGLERTDDAVRKIGGSATILPMDLKKTDDIKALGPTLYERFGGLDVFIGNAGILGGLRPVSHYNPKSWDDVFKVNVHANQALIRTLDPLLRQAEQGRAVFLTSGLADMQDPYFGAYAAAKAALNTMIRTYAEEVKNTALKVNLMRPGIVQTKLLEEAYPGGYPIQEQLIDIEDVAQEIVKLTLPDCDKTGEIISLYQDL